MINLRKNQSGQSLLEMLIAIFILVVALTATIVLVVTSISAGRDSINRLIATNLAREGLEAVRNIRDSNWIEPTGTGLWDDGLLGDGTMVPYIRPHSNPTDYLILNDTADDFGDNNTRLKIINNIYEQGPGTASIETIFYRLIYLSNICQDEDGTENIMANGITDDCNSTYGGTYEKVGIRVVSEVRWPSANSSKKVQVEERLYNWQSL